VLDATAIATALTVSDAVDAEVTEVLKAAEQQSPLSTSTNTTAAASVDSLEADVDKKLTITDDKKDSSDEQQQHQQQEALTAETAAAVVADAK
jgi:hypothetical protein